MARYWVVAPYDSKEPEVFDKAWKYDLQNTTIAVGWRDLGNISQITSLDELRSRYMDIYKDEKMVTRDCNTIWNFYNEISPGDIIIARRGRKKIVGIGAVKEPKTVYFSEEKGRERVGNLTDHYYPNFIEVNWEKKDIMFDNMMFGIYTMDEITEKKYNNIIKGKLSDVVEEELEPPTEEQKTELYVERHLEEIIVTNFDALFHHQLQLYKDEEGNIGKQYPITGENGREIGRIDILAKEPKTNSYVVIELKKGRESSKVVGQTLSYMGWIKDNLCEEGQNVKGLIICKEKDERLANALKMVPGKVNIKFYDLDLKLKD